MHNPHFFKAYCRIGIQNLPYGQNTSANGVEEAPNFVLTSEFLTSFPKSKISSFDFLKPEKINASKYFETISKQNAKFRDKLIKNVSKNETLVMIGGDHSVTFASILFDIEKHGKNIGIIHFDSHGDICSYKESPSKNFHGMYLRIFFDKFDLSFLDRLVPNKLPTSHLLFIGNLEIADGEKEYIENNFSVISHNKLNENKQQTLNQIQEFIHKFDHIHISFDVDVFDKKIAPATGTPSKNGFNKKDIFEILEIVKTAKSLTLDIAEVNPRKNGATQTIKIAQEIILTLIS